MLLSLRNHWFKTFCDHLAATYIDARFRLLEELGMAGLRPLDVKFLATIVRRHCERHGIVSAEGRESVAASAVKFYEAGVTAGDVLLRALAQEDDPDALRV